MFTPLVRAAAQKELAQKAYLFHRGADCRRNNVFIDYWAMQPHVN